MKNLKKTAIITGASKGIGKAAAILLASNNINVVVNYFQDSKAADNTVIEIERLGGTAISVQADVGKPSEITRLFDMAISKFGEVNILINNAGVILYKPIKDITEDDYDRLFSINVKSVFFAMKEAATKLADNGKIINLSSTTTRVLFPTYGLYSASKAAVEQATKVFAKEMGDRGISVNAVLPGPTKTELFLTGKSEEDLKRLSAVAAFNRIAEPEDIAKVILFLVGDEAGWINAQAIGVNGGFM
jgi:3-oxoacyl-[acyl-carrier protein] reductase